MNRKYTTLPYTEYETTAFDSNRTTIDRVVLHSTAGTLQAALNTFSSPTAQTSAHYIIDNQGKIYAGLEEYNVSYANGNYPMNQRSVTIEHVDEGATVKLHTDAQYTMSAKLVKDICTFYNIPIDSAHIIPHSSVVATACPNGLDVNKIISMAGGTIPTPPVDDCPAKLTQITAERDKLNGVITGKDQTITNLNTTISQKDSQIADLQAKFSNEQATLLTCTNNLTVAQEQAGKVPQLTQEINDLTDKVTLQAKEISGLRTDLGTVQHKFDLAKKPVQKLIIAMAEKLGINL